MGSMYFIGLLNIFHVDKKFFIHTENSCVQS